jgi:fructose-bisphosphate aldolase class I
MRDDLEEIARALTAEGKGILAADETPHTLGKRFEALSIPSTPESRRAYRELLFATPALSQFVSGVILQDETIRQSDARGEPFARMVARAGMIAGIKVDAGAKPLAACPGETVTEGLDGLRERLVEYRTMGARFAKWRGVIRISETLPSDACLAANAHALARYAALCQEEALVPIVEPEVLMDGRHSIARAELVTSATLERVFRALRAQRVRLEAMLLKPNMVVAGKDAPEQPPVEMVAAATLRVLKRQVPAALPGIVFLSGGQSERQATAHLNAIASDGKPPPWRLSFSYGRALQDSAMATWGGRAANLTAAQRALQRRARCNHAAALGTYHLALEAE